MKQIFFCLLLLVHFTQLKAQNEISSDSLQADLPSTIKNFDGFLLDMSILPKVLPAPFLPKYSLRLPDASKDYSFLLRLNSDATYTQGYTSLFSLSDKNYFSSGNQFFPSSFGTSSNLQMGSFRLKNGMRLNTYGQYNKDGWRVPSHNALPWEKNTYKGAFELKSANGNFGIRVEVEQRR